jgi:hypothetical protein
MTTTLSPIDLTHLVQVVAHATLGTRAECWCGWAGPWGADAGEAGVQAGRHADATGISTGLARAALDLLDLQDDLADAVMWLAENWARDLPAPEVLGHVHRSVSGRSTAGVTLRLRCDDSDDVTWFAALTDGVDFGRVRFVVSHRG